MLEISIDSKKFESITIQDTLNYEPVYDLEKSISSISLHVISKLKKKYTSKKLSTEQKMDFFLKNTLLSISANPVWRQAQHENNLDEDYLYLVLRKYYYRYTDI